MIGEVVKSFLMRCVLVAITIFGLCLAVEFCSVPTQARMIQIQGLHNQQSMSLQSIPFYDTYKHRNNKYFSENLNQYTVFQLQQYFSSHHYFEQEILDQSILYLSDEFVKLAKTYVGYEQAIDRLHKKFKKSGPLQKVLGTFFDTESRMAFHDTLAVDNETWNRARGWALWKALITYAELSGTNRAEKEKAKRIIDILIADL